MQKLYKHTLIAAISVLTLLTGCSKSYFDELTNNPNLVTIPPMSALLATSTTKAGLNSYTIASITNPYVQYTANPSASAASDTYQNINFTTQWDALYFAMADANELKKLAVAQSASEYKGVADVLIAYNLTLMNDLWGAGPFSEAFNTKNFTPKYDSEQDIYKAAMALIDEAIVELTKSDAPASLKLVPGSDMIYGTKSISTPGLTAREKWLRTAYALKARLLIKVSKTASFDAAAVLDAVSKSYTSNDQDAGMATFVLYNSWAQVARDNAALSLGGWLSEQLVDHLNGASYGVFDPRIRKITDPTTVPNMPNYAKWIGTVNGSGNRSNPPNNNTVKDENYIAVSSPWTSDVSPLLLVTYAELKFIEAEAAFAIDKPRAYAAYLAGVNANMDKLKVASDDPERITYMAAAAVGAASLTKDLIFKEKYVATYLNPEAWNDARRHDYAYRNFSLPSNKILPDYIRRLDYPTGERSKNGANVPAEVPRTTKLWWDQ
ncbi:MAG TPA: SusD/RagB family nutrient-binding outer membrane lipoprotein [Pedobacter sp.]|uniref:SusD/RagB family nutrient-binding outer membrane lipoprotein n=1 Tax=Pedobacter sp. TaxID=1411316 RepID=UPI002B60CBBE|nr:SusD/RagB family nutrient-binding outer membrane lipoprotein [Pedobacter sp.]HMI04709.1 SusD/RagB family nutrient-binding outer membrane lipoprotein [Pedobacter sp.]